eukprot:TRINITY_DN16403_c0_g1_i2.p3 TRINITY_DN16403_c0_g1~~TRINITY_DN16403_c0_g1_i2.p3  ORF type:complete len:103 (-),score=20.75 TRINITY_DN16403_c0_g1_i2:163-471(-)
MGWPWPANWRVWIEQKREKERDLRGGDAGGDGVGSERAIAGGDNEDIRIRVWRGGEDGPEDGARLGLSLLQDATAVALFVPVGRISSFSHSHSISFSLSPAP